MARAVRQTQQPTNSREQLLTEAVRGAYTPLYASPEQMARRRDEPADPRDDVHALGVIWYQLVTGDLTMLRVPADWTEEVRGRGLSKELIGLLGTCLASKAEKRPASAGILAAELRALTEPSARKPGSAAAWDPVEHFRAPPPLPPRQPARRGVLRQPVLWAPPGAVQLVRGARRRSVWRRPVLWAALIVLMLSAAVVVGYLWANRPARIPRSRRKARPSASPRLSPHRRRVRSRRKARPSAIPRLSPHRRRVRTKPTPSA